ncbi:MAG: winged helix-turn-helix transcriptional regulator [Lachnospiraceae bacterium]|nr:winged helix-turn-helix transcriptional regulator [Lachnospiraceae bacterium]
MLYLHSLSEAEEVFKALSTPARIKIMELVYANDNMSMNDLADALGLTNGAVSIHVAKLEAAGLVSIQAVSGKHGIMKLVKPNYGRLIIDMNPNSRRVQKNVYEDSISIGLYSSVDVHPTCGLATKDTIIGELDDPKTFSYPERFQAGILWIGWGSVSYMLPNRLRPGQRLEELQISFEISSECPEINEDYPSDIHFRINDRSLGKWISPGDYGARHGMISPSWWPPLLNQYGLLKTLIINSEGTFMDGTRRISDVTIRDLNIDYNSNITLTFSVPADTPNRGGMTLFGSTFGDYAQDIVVKAFYSATKE